MKFGDAVLAMQHGLRAHRPAWDQQRGTEPGAYLTIAEVADPEVRGGKRPAILHHAGVGTKVASRWGEVGGLSGCNDANLLADDWEIPAVQTDGAPRA